MEVSALTVLEETDEDMGKIYLVEWQRNGDLGALCAFSKEELEGDQFWVHEFTEEALMGALDLWKGDPLYICHALASFTCGSYSHNREFLSPEESWNYYKEYFLR
jgi:hypothetical protein